jgi:hypothetical protein
MKHIIYLLLFSILSLQAMAQVRITGKVTDAKDNNPIPGVTVRVRGGSAATITDPQGNFATSPSRFQLEQVIR